MKIYCVHIVECSDNSYYIGITNDLERRLTEHNAGYNTSAYTCKRRPVELKWYEMFTDPNEAIRVEKQLKGWSRRKKKALIEEDWDSLIEFSKNYTEYGNRINNDDEN